MACGMRDGEAVRQLSALGVNWVGMVFCEESPRNVQMVPVRAGIIPDKAPANLPQLEGTSGVDGTSKLERAGFFYDEMPQNIITRVVNFQLDLIVFGGHETPTLMRNLRRTLDPDIRKGIRFVKSVNVSNAESVTACRDYADCTDFFLFNLQGTLPDEQADWSLLSAYDGERPFLLGHVGPGDAGRIRGFRHPRFAGICLDTSFETEPGVMDVALMAQFLKQLK